MDEPGVKLTAYFSERDRAGGRFQADALFDVYERHGVHTSVLLRGVGGFGERHRLATDSLLTLSEDLPAVSVAIDTADRIEHALSDVLAVASHGLVTLERARLLTGEDLSSVAPVADDDRAIKLTVYGGRGARAAGQAGYVAAIELLRQSGAGGASALLAVDGTLHSERQRARFFARNANVPLMLLSVLDAAAVPAVLPGLRELLTDAVATIERVQVCKSNGVLRSPPREIAAVDASGLPVWQKLMIHAEELATAHGHPLHRALVARLWEAGAAGVTVLRGVRGFYAGGEVFADRLLSLRRNVPVHVVLVDTPANIQRLWPVVDEMTAEAGMVTSELVPAGGQRLWKNPALQAR
jgi:PII-like signaling protein